MPARSAAGDPPPETRKSARGFSRRLVIAHRFRPASIGWNREFGSLVIAETAIPTPDATWPSRIRMHRVD